MLKNGLCQRYNLSVENLTPKNSARPVGTADKGTGNIFIGNPDGIVGGWI
jgi:hypothetical protein